MAVVTSDDTYPLHIEDDLVIRENQGDRSSQNSNRALSNELAQIFGQVGIAVVVPLFLGVIIGNIVDRKFAVYPAGTLSGICLGFILSIVNLVNITKKVMRLQSKK